MRMRAALTAIALGRVLIGGAMAAAPEKLVGPNWVGAPEAQRSPTRLLFRSVGARDVGLGLGTLNAMRQGASLRPWVLAAALADGADLLATLAARRAIPLPALLGTSLVAGGALAAELALVRELA